MYEFFTCCIGDFRCDCGQRSNNTDNTDNSVDDTSPSTDTGTDTSTGTNTDFR